LHEIRYATRPASIEARRVVVQLEMTLGLRRRTDMDDDALVRGDGRVAKGSDVALRRAPSRSGARARSDQARIHDDEVGGDARHGVSVTQVHRSTIPQPMSLVAGSRIGAYEVAAQIGAGGMGEVYRATDTKLKRLVAIKVLPEALAADPERLARFQREAEVLASLNHQNIAQLHGLEDEGGVRALVMELVEGPTLADRIAQGALPVDEALAIAKQVAAALEAAHEQGITHRDLKPANVKVRPDGTVKVLDFGLAKLAEPTPGSNAAATMSPTLSLNATMAGVILGTAAYMAPEQARGKTVDKRADIWAFDAVLYEMLTGSQPFPGEDISHVLARVIDRDPDWFVGIWPEDLGKPSQDTERRIVVIQNWHEELKRRMSR
jgi:serine/threonine protein kinase